MNIHLTAIGLKWLGSFLILALFGLLFGPSPYEALFISFVVAVVSWFADRVLPFKVQGITRWVIDGGLAGVTIYLAQFLWPGTGLSLFASLFAGFAIGSAEIPLHFYLASRYGVRRPQDDKDGIR